MQKIFKVELQLKSSEVAAREVAYEVLKRVNSHGSPLIDAKLEKAGVNLETMTKYFQQLTLVVAEFWNAARDFEYKPTLPKHMVKGLYLPTLYAVILSSVGNTKVGNYEYVIKAIDKTGVDKEFIIEFSATLESLRMYVSGNIGQIGNDKAEPQTSVMLAILGEVIDGNATLHVKDGVSYDTHLAGFAALAGIALVEEADKNLYTQEEMINFRELVMTVKESKSGGLE